MIFKRKNKGIYNSELLKEYNKQRTTKSTKYLCNAPHTSIFFNVLGMASPYCRTIGKIDAQYPNLSIKEIWNGEGFNKLRKQIADNNLSDICSFCHHSLVSKNFRSMLASKFDDFSINKAKYPSTMEFELSNTCNLSCIMCNGILSSSYRAKNLDLAPIKMRYDQNFVEQLKEFIPHLEQAEFVGGEPLLINIYYEIWELISILNPKCKIKITTNGNIINTRFRQLMNKLQNISFSVSIDSLSPDVYSNIRVGGNLETVLNNINEFHSYCKKNNTTLELLVCPLQTNWHELPQLLEFANKLEVYISFLNVIKPYHLTLKTMKPKDLAEVLDFLNQTSLSSNSSIEELNKNNFKVLIAQIETWHNQSLQRESLSSTLKIPFEIKFEREMELYQSIWMFFEDNFGMSEDIKNKFDKMCVKINTTLAMQKNKADVNNLLEILLCIPLDISLMETIIEKSENELAEMLLQLK